jgi:hypothetical protein
MFILAFTLWVPLLGQAECEQVWEQPTIEECSASDKKNTILPDEEIGYVIVENQHNVYRSEKCLYDRMQQGIGPFKSSPAAYREKTMQNAYDQCEKILKDTVKALAKTESDKILQAYEASLKKCADAQGKSTKDYPSLNLIYFLPDKMPKKLILTGLTQREDLLQCKLISVLKTNKEIHSKIPSAIDTAVDSVKKIFPGGDNTGGK